MFRRHRYSLLILSGALLLPLGCWVNIVKQAPAQAIACLCPGPPGRLAANCLADFRRNPIDGAVKVVLDVGCVEAHAIETDSLGNPACRLRITSGNATVLKFIPNEVLVSVGTTTVQFDTQAVDPEIFGPHVNPVVPFTVIDVNNSEPRASGSVVVSTACEEWIL